MDKLTVCLIELKAKLKELGVKSEFRYCLNDGGELISITIDIVERLE